MAIAELNTAGNDGDPWLSPDRRTIFFARSPPGATSLFQGPFTIYRADRRLFEARASMSIASFLIKVGKGESTEMAALMQRTAG